MWLVVKRRKYHKTLVAIVAEWLRRLIRNQIPSGSPTDCEGWLTPPPLPLHRYMSSSSWRMNIEWATITFNILISFRNNLQVEIYELRRDMKLFRNRYRDAREIFVLRDFNHDCVNMPCVCGIDYQYFSFSRDKSYLYR